MHHIICFSEINIHWNNFHIYLNGLMIWGWILAVGFGVGLILFLAHFVRKARRCSVSVDAQVTALERHEREDEEGRTVVTYRPEYTFWYEGAEYKVLSAAYTDGKQYPVGTVVTLRIDPNQPEIFLDPMRDEKVTVLCSVVMAVFMGVGILMIWFGRQRF